MGVGGDGGDAMVSELWVAVEAVLNDDAIPADTWSEVSTVFFKVLSKLVWVDDDCLELALPPLLLLQRASLVDFAIMIKNRDNRITLSGCSTMLLTCAWQLRCILEYKCRRFIFWRSVSLLWANLRSATLLWRCWGTIGVFILIAMRWNEGILQLSYVSDIFDSGGVLRVYLFHSLSK